jgi:hypothetical protein
VKTQTQKLVLPSGKVAPFPRERFLGFLRHLKILTKEFGIVPLRMLGTQRYVLDEICQGLDEGVTSFVILKARQLGMSTFFIALDLFWAFEHRGLSGAFATHTDQSKNQFRNIIQLFLTNLPKNYKVDDVKENRDFIVFKNASMFSYMVAGVKEKSTSNMGRSGAYNFLHATEVAFWGSPDDLAELAAALSTHNPHRLEIIETTANGFNHFQELWEAAKGSKTQRAIFVGWWRNELYAFPEAHPYFTIYMPDGIHTQPNAMERRRAKMVKDQYDFDITPEQLAWYRWQLDEKQSGDQMSMDEKFPWVEDDAFVASGSNFFTSVSLTEAMRRSRKQPYLPFRYVLGSEWHETGVIATTGSRAELKIWEEMSPNGHYSIGCDPAFGSSDQADRTVIHVARCFADRLVQVAEFVSASTSTYQCAWVLAHLAGYYRASMVVLELSGGAGQTVLDELNRLQRALSQMPQPGAPDLRNVLGLMRHYMYRRIDLLSGQLCYQWKTTAENKFAMMTAMKDAFELHRFLINSLPCLEEMKSLVYDGGTLKGEGRRKDDRAMAAGLAHEGWRKWVLPKMVNMGLTFEQAYKEETSGPRSQAEQLAINYLRAAKVLQPGQTITPQGKPGMGLG